MALVRIVKLRLPPPLTRPAFWFNFFLLLFVLLCTAGCASTGSKGTGRSVPPRQGSSEVGVASFYAAKYHGRRTASGEVYNMRELSAAHREHPFGTTVKVTNLNNNRAVVVRINDRGPFVRSRIIDVSLAAAQQLGMVRAGLAKVKVEILDRRQASIK